MRRRAAVQRCIWAGRKAGLGGLEGKLTHKNITDKSSELDKVEFLGNILRWPWTVTAGGGYLTITFKPPGFRPDPGPVNNYYS